jgi:hypothetical protein
VRDFFRFRSGYTGRLELVPCLHDWYEEGSTTKSEYFWENLLVARMIFEEKPERYVDIGSRVDGLVAHVASFREIEVFDARPITTPIPGVTFKQDDLMKPVEGMEGYCASLSCLEPIIAAAKMIKRHWKGVLQFITSRITTGIVEGLNSKIKTAMKRAYGFKSFEYLRTVIYLAAGKINIPFPTQS